MTEKVDYRICDSLQSYREEGSIIQVSIDHNYYDLGCMESSLDLRPSAFKTGLEKEDVRGTKKPEPVGREYNDNTASSNSAHINSEGMRVQDDRFDAFSEGLGISKHRLERTSKTSNAHIIDIQRTTPQVHVCNGKDTSQLHTPISILVEKFEDKSRIENFIGIKTDYGMVFLDCYGRVFELDDESQFLWPLGDFPKEIQKYSFTRDMLGWFVENGVVREYIRKSYCIYLVERQDVRFFSLDVERLTVETNSHYNCGNRINQRSYRNWSLLRKRRIALGQFPTEEAQLLHLTVLLRPTLKVFHMMFENFTFDAY
ncbi:hypothetical protein GLOIN_2v1480847 [Rhizophagus clarus]|uniref:Uncharacterized protein n=1 Tax=Rhizophagus clarus TaxID=94130 RepID=A0A8H3QJ94_9GLOM|nr:hypothetical protein GLOIN_2v1480847 [Rhizophagus clarus]